MIKYGPAKLEVKNFSWWEDGKNLRPGLTNFEPKIVGLPSTVTVMSSKDDAYNMFALLLKAKWSEWNLVFY